jgi:putative Mg2+ transporter-C (MgtC) family protein
MAIEVSWSQITLRLLCALVAGSLIGLNRSGHGHAAGLRTSILVSLAACIAMIQVNLLLPLAGRPSGSFVMNDLMRLPLGILSGMGFIGAGAIIRRGTLVAGVTTAATLWLLTVLGLCFGGGQVTLGLVGAALGVLVLTGLKFLENRMTQDRQGTLFIVTAAAGPDEAELRRILQNDGLRIVTMALATTRAIANYEMSCVLRWRAKSGDSDIPQSIRRLMVHEGVLRIGWTPQAR